MKKQVIGILAHVDAGKTTLTEAMLYESGRIRKAGRVDHQDTVMDFDAEERSHGITIYSKETWYEWKDTETYVIDTPGHVDFSSEMERVLSVLDLAVILISGQDGVQAHTETIWNCLEHYHIPAVIFMNKMDISYRTKEELLSDLRKHCSDNCFDYVSDDRNDTLAMVNEEMMNTYLETGDIPFDMIKEAVYRRECFPVLYGSALKMDGVKALMDLIADLQVEKEYPEEFGAIVYKISESKGERLTHMKITGGRLNARQKINEEEKADQIRRYSGLNYEMKEYAEAGEVCVVKGLKTIEAGTGLGFEKDSAAPLINACMNYELIAPKDADRLLLNETCRRIAEEDPSLQISIDPKSGRIQLQLMGEMQMEVLQKKILERSGVHVTFGTGRIIYLETIADEVDGAGHFEPLRHYAEVHVRLEPLKRGTGILVSSECSQDDLSMNFQRPILESLERKRHKGVLTGSLLTDVKIVLTAGKGHLKHTEGGDFRQASTRAVRQALMKAENILLEPYYSFELKLPQESLSRALYDLETRGCTVEVSEDESGVSVSGRGPVRTLINYQNEVTAYTKGRGRFLARQAGYDVCSDAEKIVNEISYDPLDDYHNSPNSVFCEHGSGVQVPWNEADERMHVQLKKGNEGSSGLKHRTYTLSEDDLDRVLNQAGSNNRNQKKKDAEYQAKKREEEKERQKALKEAEKARKKKQEEKLPLCLVVDGYNMIFGWERMKPYRNGDISIAREALIDILFRYQPYTNEKMIIVFDGYKVKDNSGSSFEKGKNFSVVYTRSKETADQYIERIAWEMKGKYDLTVATSDALIQNAAFAAGGKRLSARELENQIDLREKISGGVLQ